METQDANFLFQKYLKEDTAGQEPGGSLGKAKDETWGDVTFSDKGHGAQTPRVLVYKSINSTCRENRETEGVDPKIKLELKFGLENSRRPL